MELNLAVSSVRITTCREQPPSVEGVQLRETRSSYFLNIKLLGLRKEDIQLEMEKERCLVIRGERYSQDMGMLRWKWRVVESGTPTKPFIIPEDVNVGGIRASFEQGVLHLSMPKLSHNTFTPYHVFHIHSSHHPPLPHRPHQPHKQQEEANNMGDKLATISEDADMKIELLPPGHPEEEEDGKMWAEVPARECASSNSVQSVDDSIKKEVCVSQSENQQEDVLQGKDGDVEETIGKGVEAQETGGASSFKVTDASDAQIKRVPLLQEGEEKEKKGYYEKVKGERGIISNGYNIESDMSEHPKPFLCEGLSQIFSAIAAIARRKRRCP